MGALSSKRQLVLDTIATLQPIAHENESNKPFFPETWAWHGSPGNHSPYPIDVVRYPGEEEKYCFIDILASYSIMNNNINLGPNIVHTNAGKFLPELNACYEQGYKLKLFVKIPSIRTTLNKPDWSKSHPYQAIFTKNIPSEGSTYETVGKSWKIAVENRVLSTRTLSSIDSGSGSMLLSTIIDYASIGARLVCIEPVGFVQTASINNQYSVMGVNLFFEVPKQPEPTKYIYHAINVPTRYVVIPDATQTLLQIDCDADWMGQLQIFLEQGWKLVDICIDSSNLSEAFSMASTSKAVDAIWFFEKDATTLEDMSPKYEGVIIEYMHKVKRTPSGEVPCRDWRPVIAGMGVTGWELTTVVQTPIIAQSSLTVYTMKLLFVFQRPYIEEHQQLVKAYNAKHSKRYHGVLGDTLSKTLNTKHDGTLKSVLKTKKKNRPSSYHDETVHSVEIAKNNDQRIAVQNGTVPHTDPGKRKLLNRRSVSFFGST